MLCAVRSNRNALVAIFAGGSQTRGLDRDLDRDASPDAALARQCGASRATRLSAGGPVKLLAISSLRLEVFPKGL